MAETRLTLEVDGVEIPAVLSTPEAARASGWAVLLIPGSLNADVDGNFAPMFPGQPPARPHVYKDLAEQMAAAGLAVLRFSKRGPGTNCVTRDEALARERYREFPQRVRVAEAFLDELARRVPGARMAAAGHSEGAVVATLLAQSRTDVQALVLLSGPAKPLLELMLWQRHRALHPQGAPPETERQLEQAIGWARDYAAGGELPEAWKENAYASFFEFFLRPDARPYLESLERVNPAAELAQVRQPVMIVQGGRDTSVTAVNAELLQAAAPGARVERFPELNHMYKRVAEGMTPEASFLIETDSDPAVARAIAGWLGRG